jgi:two-component system, NtrC family, sensor histidine kinase KinB
MLRLRLLLGLLMLTALLWGVGAASLLLMRDSGRQFEKRLQQGYAVIDAAQNFRTLTSTLDHHYLPTLAAPAPPALLEPHVFEELRDQILEKRSIIQNRQSADSQADGVLNRFDYTLELYFEGYRQLFSGAAVTPEERAALLQSISSQAQSLVLLSDNIMNLSEQQLFMSAHGLREEARRNRLLIIVLVLLATAIAGLTYFLLVRHLIDPVTGLRQSIDEVRRGNFELAIPEPGRPGEISDIVQAFNEMATEIKVRRGEADEHLIRANLVNRAILAAIPSPVFILEDDDGIMLINPAAEELTQNLGVGGRLPVKIQTILDQCRQEGTHFLPEDPRDALLFRIDEQEYYFLPRIFRFVAEDGSRSGWAVLLHNVSRIRWLDDMKTNLLSTVSHEIKTPLTGIRMVLHLLLEEKSGSLDEMQRTMVASANDDCERLLKTLNTLLDLSRAESGATQLDRTPVRLEKNVDRVIQLYSEHAAARQVRLEKQIPQEELPEVLADPVRLDEVINNLVSNAIKHSPSNSAVILRISKPESPEFLRLSVIDHGPGVPETSQGRLFERFFRAPGQKIEGVGLGLFISREIMRAHEGRIGLRERMGNETEFFIDVPIA